MQTTIGTWTLHAFKARKAMDAISQSSVMRSLRFVLIVYLAVAASLQTSLAQAKCGYESCDFGYDDPKVINVHLVPHTHDDVGWLKTVDQYFYGTRNYIQPASVNLILDTVVGALAANPERKFTYVEMEFFTKWWLRQTDQVKKQVNSLVQNGQLHFVLGGISMSDEAACHYEDSINQLTWGINFLTETFGECGRPRVAWQIDPFGHARDQARIFHDAGFDAVYFQRMDYREKQQRRENRSLEFLWLTDPSAQLNGTQYNSKSFFTGILRDSYCYPSTFCFDTHCQDEQLIDDPSSPENNVQRRVTEFIRYLDTVRSSFRTNHMIIPMGCDFTYENALKNFYNSDILIKHANERFEKGESPYRLMYSTPTCYTGALNRAFNQLADIPVRDGDFFPYASSATQYWTGFYTSRPSFKYLTRKLSNELRVCEQANLISAKKLLPLIKSSTTGDNKNGVIDWGQASRSLYENRTEAVDNLRRVMGIAQHHDAITGTEKQQVAYDYVRMMTDYGELTLKMILQVHALMTAGTCNSLIGQVLAKEANLNVQPVSCNLLNISLCDATFTDPDAWRAAQDGQQMLNVDILVYNPTSHDLSSSWLRLPVYVPDDAGRSEIRLTDRATGVDFKTQLMKVSSSTERIPERQWFRKDANANQELFAQITAGVPAMGFKVVNLLIKNIKRPVNSYSRSAANQTPTDTRSRIRSVLPDENSITNASHILTFQNTATNTNYTLQAEILYYTGHSDYLSNSGAYIFNPEGEANRMNTPRRKLVRGPMVEHLYLDFADWAQLTVRRFHDGQTEVDWTVGPIPDNLGSESREVIVRYTIFGPTYSASNEFYVDSNGHRLIKRRRKVNFSSDPATGISGSYYPAISRVILPQVFQEEAPISLAVYTDRAQVRSAYFY